MGRVVQIVTAKVYTWIMGITGEYKFHQVSTFPHSSYIQLLSYSYITGVLSLAKTRHKLMQTKNNH